MRGNSEMGEKGELWKNGRGTRGANRRYNVKKGKRVNMKTTLSHTVLAYLNTAEITPANARSISPELAAEENICRGLDRCFLEPKERYLR